MPGARPAAFLRERRYGPRRGEVAIGRDARRDTSRIYPNRMVQGTRAIIMRYELWGHSRPVESFAENQDDPRKSRVHVRRRALRDRGPRARRADDPKYKSRDPSHRREYF